MDILALVPLSRWSPIGCQCRCSTSIAGGAKQDDNAAVRQIGSERFASEPLPGGHKNATLGNLLTLCVFGALGVFVAGRMKVPVSVRTLALLLAAALVGAFVGSNTALLSVFGVRVLLNWVIASCCLGLLAGLLARRLRPAGW
jgi:hypothetical protein